MSEKLAIINYFFLIPRDNDDGLTVMDGSIKVALLVFIADFVVIVQPAVNVTTIMALVSTEPLFSKDVDPND
jgi:hypothetical protein